MDAPLDARPAGEPMYYTVKDCILTLHNTGSPSGILRLPRLSSVSWTGDRATTGTHGYIYRGVRKRFVVEYKWDRHGVSSVICNGEKLPRKGPRLDRIPVNMEVCVQEPGTDEKGRVRMLTVALPGWGVHCGTEGHIHTQRDADGQTWLKAWFASPEYERCLRLHVVIEVEEDEPDGFSLVAADYELAVEGTDEEPEAIPAACMGLDDPWIKRRGDDAYRRPPDWDGHRRYAISDLWVRDNGGFVKEMGSPPTTTYKLYSQADFGPLAEGDVIKVMLWFPEGSFTGSRLHFLRLIDEPPPPGAAPEGEST